MKRTVSLIELSIFENIAPLVSGYLEAYARADSGLDAEFHFEKNVALATTSVEALTDSLSKTNSQVYAFSCYQWNMGRVRSLLSWLGQHRSDSYVLLGGPHAINQADKIVPPGSGKVAVCNDAGERVFRDFLQQVASGKPDFSQVAGLSFWRDGELLTTPPDSPMVDLDEIPSPFLSGCIEPDRYTYTVIETNRGCPYACGFCFWGAGSRKIYKFSDERIKEEIEWLAKNKFLAIFLGDANWGMYPRDVEFSQLIADCKRKYGTPLRVIFNASKKKSPRFFEIAEIFGAVGMAPTQTIAMQSLDERTLKVAKRVNIKESELKEVRKELTSRNVSSYGEVIWPLPGETLESFKSGVERLCTLGFDSVAIYALTLLPGTPYQEQSDDLGIKTELLAKGVEEIDVVVGTNEVSAQDYTQGLWFAFAFHSLFNCRTLYHVSRYLHQSQVGSYSDLFASFAEFCQGEGQEFEVPSWHQSVVTTLGQCDPHYHGLVVHKLLEASNRAETTRLVSAFCARQPWWADAGARAAFEIDLLNRPYVYRPARIAAPEVDLEHFRVVEVAKHALRVDVSEVARDVLRAMNLSEAGDQTRGSGYSVAYVRPAQMPYMQGKGLNANVLYCHAAVLQTIRDIQPTWTPS